MASEPQTNPERDAPSSDENGGAEQPKARRAAPKRARGAATGSTAGGRKAPTQRAAAKTNPANGVAAALAEGVTSAASGAASAVTDAPGAIRKRAGKLVETVRGGAQDAAGKVHDAADTMQHAAEGALRTARAKVKDVLPERRAGRKTAAKADPKTKAARKGAGTGTVIGIAAAGIAAGVALNLGRKAAVQAPSALAGDWFEAVKGEHRAAIALFDALQSTTDAQTHRRSVLLIQLKHALTKHALTEENVIYPALREASEIGKGEADKLNHEHGYVKDYLYHLEMMSNGDAGFLAKVAEFRSDLEAHIREEETDVFPALHAKLGDAKNKVITLAANKEGFKAA